MAQLGDMTKSRPQVSARQLAADVLRVVPHEHLMMQLGRYCLTNPEAAPFLNKTSVNITVKGLNAFDWIREQLLDGKITAADLRTLVRFAVSLYKDFPTGMSLVTESNADGELWHSLDEQGTELRWIIYLSPARAKRLEKNETIKFGFYAVSPSQEMKREASEDQVTFIKLFHCFYGIDRRPVFLGDLERVPQFPGGVPIGPLTSSVGADGVSTAGSSGDLDKRYVTTLFSAPAGTRDQRVRTKDTQIKHPRNADYFQFVLPHGLPYSAGEGGAALTRAFIAKALELCNAETDSDKEERVVRFDGVVHARMDVRLSHLQATHNVGLPFPVIPKPTWRLVSLLDANGKPMSIAPLIAAVDKVKPAPVKSGAYDMAAAAAASAQQAGDSSSKKKRHQKSQRKQALGSGSMYQ